MPLGSDQFHIRLARINEVERLREIEDAAGELFNGLGLLDEGNDPGLALERIAALIELEQAWVICGPDERPVGMAVASDLGGELYLEEIDVLPAYGRQGLGARLLEYICDWAKAKGFVTVTLSTFRDVAWNGPFYRKHGFSDLVEHQWDDSMYDIRTKESQYGLRVEERVFMRRIL